jgi:hypothetical protein
MSPKQYDANPLRQKDVYFLNLFLSNFSGRPYISNKCVNSSLWIQMNFYPSPDGPTYPVRLLLFYFAATLIILDGFHIILFAKELG